MSQIGSQKTIEADIKPSAINLNNDMLSQANNILSDNMGTPMNVLRAS